MKKTLFMTAAMGGIILWCGGPACAWMPPGTFNQTGNILIADQFNNRVIETDRKGTIVWSWGLGPHDFSANSPLGVNDSERVGNDTLMSATGIPPKVDPYCKKGCPDNRVLLVDPSGNIVWQYGQFGVTGSGPDELNAPVQSTWTPEKTVYITDQGNQRVIEVDMKKNILWQYGTTGVSGSGFDELNNPNSAELLANGDVLIADESNNRVIEVQKGESAAERSDSGCRRREQPGHHPGQGRQYQVPIRYKYATGQQLESGSVARNKNNERKDRHQRSIQSSRHRRGREAEPDCPIRKSERGRLWHDKHPRGTLCAL
jgi:hypothetical protein